MSNQNDFRLVHLDLKGAPPRLGYYHEIFPLMKEWGVTGLLVEYEDMFPYSGEFKCLCAPYVYSPEDIADLLKLANLHGLEVIPLVQSIGHFEFVLKHEKFRYLREVNNYPMAVCPSHADSLDVVIGMFAQVLHLHPNIRWMHIGADEMSYALIKQPRGVLENPFLTGTVTLRVFHLGICEACLMKMHENNWTKTDLLLDYLCRLLRQCRLKFPSVTFIMWDDMMRSISDISGLQKCGIGNLVELMVWHYLAEFQLEQDLFARYSKVFSNIWAASAFKGATGPLQQFTDINYHLQNHKEWIALMSEESNRISCFRGYAITGWQRYDHYAAMCELFPVALPSLAVCLSILKHGVFNKEIHKSVSEQLGFSDMLPLTPCLDMVPECKFPGSEIYTAFFQFIRLDVQFHQLLRNERLLGWMNDYQVRRNFTNPVHIEQFMPVAVELLDSFQKLSNTIQSVLSRVFYQDTVEEWLEVNMAPKVNKLTTIVETGQQQIALAAGVKNMTPNDSMNSKDKMDVNHS